MGRLALVLAAVYLGCAHPADPGGSKGGPSTEALQALGDSQVCTVSTDCTGMMPHKCSQCSDGTSACAHWACVHGACEIATCAADAGSR
jgi:hypothetical protein